MIRIDLHTHTGASFDSWISPERYIETAVRAGLDAVAVTDHQTIDGALAVRDLDPPFAVIVGQEILTAEGEVIGLFLETQVPAGRSPEETIDRIHDQGGLALLPHPFARYAFDRLTSAAVHRVASRADLVEIANARNRAVDDAAAARFARRIDLPGTAGSDSHAPWEMGLAYQEVRPFDDPADLVDALAGARPIVRKRTPVFVSGLSLVYGWGSLLLSR